MNTLNLLIIILTLIGVVFGIYGIVWSHLDTKRRYPDDPGQKIQNPEA